MAFFRAWGFDLCSEHSFVLIHGERSSRPTSRSVLTVRRNRRSCMTARLVLERSPIPWCWQIPFPVETVNRQ